MVVISLVFQWLLVVVPLFDSMVLLLFHWTMIPFLVVVIVLLLFRWSWFCYCFTFDSMMFDCLLWSLLLVLLLFHWTMIVTMTPFNGTGNNDNDNDNDTGKNDNDNDNDTDNN